MSKRQPLLAQRTGPLMGANPARVLLRRMYPSSHKKAENIVERINALSDAQVAAELSFIIDEWNHRHDNLRTSLRHRYREVCLNLRSSFQDWSEDRKCLVGAYFLQEYSVESAALFNPSIVSHPDQSNVAAGNMRVILSLRATGEGHISSVTFREGVLTTHNRMILEPSLLRLVEAKRQTSDIEVAAFTKELRESHMRTKAWKQEHTAFYEAFMKLIGDQESFSVDQARQACAALLNQFKSEAADTAANAILMLAEANYTVRFEKGSALSQRVLFPSAPSQSNGIEDARFVRFVHDDGSIMYYATFTAYNGRSTLSQIMETSDFNSFRFVSLSGEVREKGMALFPRKVGGSYVMLSRQDDESVMITFSQSLYKWEDPIALLKPVEPWESFKMGNCGSPIETPQGWIVITHGVGPMRRYSIGAALLDLKDPTKVLARLKDPLIAPNEVEREGYVPNVVYSCGSMLRGDTLIIPFANSDSVSSFASVSVTSLMSAFQRSHTDVVAPTLKPKVSQKAPQAPVAPVAPVAPTAPTAPAAPAIAESAPLSGTGSALTTPAAPPANSPARRVKHDFVRRIVFIGDYLPRKCGIATFTHDLRCALAAEFPNVDCVVVAVNDNDDGYMYSKEVIYEFKEQDPVTYLRVADYINGCGADVVCVQHEYGIYGGPCGVMLLQLLRALRVPIVTTLHTILQDPNPDQRQILASILSASSIVVTMAQKGMELLNQVYLADMSKVRIILHGIPEMEYPDTAVYKAKLGFDPTKKIILTFGLLGPNKGIEFAIDALGTTINRTSNFTYVVLGQTHPGIIKNHGEMYRHGLAHQAKERGLNDHIVFVDQFVDLPLLKEYIAACDIYLTPYLHEAQITSGTLSYAFGMGSAVVSTPYWHASELLADGRGCLVPFRDSEKLANILADLLLDDNRRIALKKQAFEHGRTMTWSNSAAHYMEAFEMAAATRKKIEVQPQPRSTLPAVKLDHLMRLTDDTGLIQHARFSVPDREHGYCVDDNARALLLYSRLKDAKFAFPPDTAHRIDTYFAFVAHAQDLRTRRFRNFMRFDRDWLEEVGSEDSHGRTIQALGACVRFDVHRDAATSLFLESFALVKDFSSPRSWAFSLLGFVDFLSAVPHHEVVELRDDLVERLVKTFDHHAKDDWQWFEATATYDNAVLPQSLLVAGSQMNNSRAVQVGLQSLAWLFNKQVTPDNIFVPIGNDGWAHSSGMMALFDQQPLEASSMCQACIAADRIATQDDTWGRRARIAFDWFMGRNVLGKPLYDPRSHGCCDGLHEFRINLNQGGESILAYLLGLVELKRDELGRSQTPTPKLGFSMALPGVA